MEKEIIKKVKINEFMNMFTQIFQIATKAFFEIKSNKKELTLNTKDLNEKFTDLDWTIQKIIVNYINEYYPGIKFIGEEDISENLKVNCLSEYISKPEKILFNPISEDLFPPENNEYNLNELCVYCDPIDGTSSLIKKEYHNVSCLVGLTYKKSPLVGLVHFFSYKKESSKTFLNIPGKGIYSLIVDEKQIQEDKIDFSNLKYELSPVKLNKNENMSFVITATRENPTMTKIISYYPNAEVSRISGLGTKAVISLLDDYFYFSPSKGLGYWDVCAGHALFKEIGGSCCYLNGEEILYPENFEEKIIESVFSMSTNKEKIKNFNELLKKENIII